MNIIFEVIDKTNRKLRMTDYAWKHIMKKHPMMQAYFEEMQIALRNPTAITISLIDSSVHYYYLYLKNKAGSNKYLFLSGACLIIPNKNTNSHLIINFT